MPADTDPAQCEQDCDADPECRAWTYVGKSSDDGGGDGDDGSTERGYPVPRCCLKNDSHVRPRPAAQCTSGIKPSGGAKPSVGKGHTALLVTVGADAAPQSAAELLRVGTDGKATVVDSATSFKCGPDATCGVATVTG